MIKGHLAKLTDLVGGGPGGLRDEADRLRDAAQYAEAAEFYRRYLSLRPDDFDIWVQRGNCLKDAGAMIAAKLAYEAAAKLRPEDADLNLQLGHLMKLQGFRADAIKYYRQSQKLDPLSGLAEAELRGFGIKIKSLTSPLESRELKARPARILDITDLVSFFFQNTRVTGIQRVQCCLVEKLLAEGANAGSSDVVLAYIEHREQAIYAVSSARVKELISVVGSQDATASGVKSQVQNILDSKAKMTPRAQDSYLILGGYCVGGEYSSILLSLKAAGVCIGVYVYDLIPITHPEYVSDSTRYEVLEKLGDVLALADFVLTISEYVAKEVALLLSSELDRQIPVLPVPLAHELPKISEGDGIDEEFKVLLPREYVLCVGTLEARKNQQLLLDAWSSLYRKRAGRLPHLILVGKWGWRIEAFREELQAQGNVDGKVVVLGDVSDAQLAHLYEHCLFTVFPSFVEGWGLPVGESLAWGKPCIASSRTSIPEVGGDFCRYINPYDPLEATAEIERAIVDRAGLEAWASRIARAFKVRTWAEVATDLLAKAHGAEALARKSSWRAAVTLDGGKLYRLTRPGIYGTDSKSWRGMAVKYVCASGWWPFEDWGAWSGRRVATIEFGTPLPPKTEVRLFMKLSLPAPHIRETITIEDSSRDRRAVTLKVGNRTWTRFESQTDDRGNVKVMLERHGDVTHVEPSRELYVGISALAYYAKDNLAQQAELHEELLLFDNLS